jgi:PAS domain S-box-containing protein
MPATCKFKPSQVSRIRELTNTIIADETSLQMFMKLSSDLHCVVLPNGQLRRLNDAWERQLGWTRQECLEYPLTHFMHADDAATAIEYLNAATEDAVQFEARLRMKNTDRFISYEWNMAAGRDGNIYATARATQTR